MSARPLSPSQKLATANALWHSARALKLAMLKATHPDWSDERLRAEVRRIFLLAASTSGPFGEVLIASGAPKLAPEVIAN